MGQETEKAEDLWRRALGRDAEARADLGRFILETARADLAHHPLDAALREELASSTVASCLRFLDRGGTVSRSLVAFVKHRVRGVLSDHWKRRRTERRIRLQSLDTDEGPEPADPAAPPLTGLVLQEAVAAMRHCLGQLQPGYAQVLEMRNLHRLESAAIAARLGVAVATVRVRAFRALELLRECMEGRGFSAWDLA